MILHIQIIYFFLLMLFVPIALCQKQLHLIATMTGDSTGDLFEMVAGVGDVNGDDYDDFVVGAPGGNYAKVFFGGPTFDTTHYVKLIGEHNGARFGRSVAGGDINGDGYSDIIIGDPYYCIGGPFGIVAAGKIYVYFGGLKFDTIPALTFSPGSWYYFFGQSICVAGDLNGDGFKDIVVGAPNDDIDAHGRAYIYYGGSPMADTTAVILEGTEWFDSFGESVAGVGDVNKDGFGDILIGAPQGLKGRPYYGKAYLIYGGQNIRLSNSTCFVEDSTAYDQYGRIVAGLGDINGDSISDFGIMALNKVNIYIGGIQIDTIPKLTLHPRRDFGFIAGLGDLNKDGFNDFVAVSDSVRIYFGSISPDSVSDIIMRWATPVCSLGRIDSNEYNDIACAIGGGWDPRGKIYIYSYGFPDGVDEEYLNPPVHFKLEQNYPNPFNPETTIGFEITERSLVTLKIFDILGREIATLINEDKFPGNYTVRWNAAGMSSGVYFYRLKTKSSVLQKKMILTK